MPLLLLAILVCWGRLLSHSQVSGLQDSASSDLLFSKIYDSRHKYVVPPKVNGMFNVTLGVTITQLSEVDDVKQTVTLLLWMDLTWFDTRLAWQGRLFDSNITFNSIDQIMIPNSLVWKPDLYVFNDVRNFQNDMSQFFVKISSQGRMQLEVAQRMKISCPLNLAKFPYDKQTCKMKIGSWAMTVLHLTLLYRSSTADLSILEEDNEFCVTGAPVTKNIMKLDCCPDEYEDLTYAISMQRKPLFYEINLLMPCIAILIVALFGFCLPADSGERISLCVTVLLALSVFLELASEHTPTQSDVVPLISCYFLVSICISVLCVIGNVLVLTLHYNGEQGRTMGARTERCCRLLCRLVRLPGFPEADDAGDENAMEKPPRRLSLLDTAEQLRADEDGGGTTPLPPSLAELARRIDAAMFEVTAALVRMRASEQLKAKWAAAVQATDRLLFAVSMTCFAAFVIVVIANRPREALAAAADCTGLRASLAT